VVGAFPSTYPQLGFLVFRVLFVDKGYRKEITEKKLRYRSPQSNHSVSKGKTGGEICFCWMSFSTEACPVY
jgi:hypothetical protein